MTKEQFAPLMARLAIAFDRKLEKDRFDVFFESFKDAHAEAFSGAIAKVIETEPRFPTVAVIKAHLTGSSNGSGSAPEYCKRCGNSGFIAYWPASAIRRHRRWLEIQHGAKLTEQEREADDFSKPRKIQQSDSRVATCDCQAGRKQARWLMEDGLKAHLGLGDIAGHPLLLPEFTDRTDEPVAEEVSLL